MRKIICSAVAILLTATTFASGNVVVKDALVFGDNTKQTTATVQGPVGLQGAKGDTGSDGPVGPQGPPGNNSTVILASVCAAITAGGAPLPAFCGPTYTVTSVVSGGNGSISPLGDSQVYSGQTKSFTVTPNSGYAPNVTGCAGSLSGNSFTTGAINAACTVTATFSATGGPTLTDPTTGMVLLKVTGGTFTMGDTFGDSGVGSAELPTHQVTLSDFYIGRYEVTQAEWQTVMTGNTSGISATPSYFSACGTSCPVEQVSWNYIQVFISRLNGMSGKNYRLPTEAEWEYAARSGGQSQKYSGGSDVNAVAWYSVNSGSTTHTVGQKQANGLGLYDMSGNVWEWVSDWYGAYGSAAETNPTGPATGSARVARGGCWYNVASYGRASDRGSSTPGIRGNNIGFRLVAPVQ